MAPKKVEDLIIIKENKPSKLKIPKNSKLKAKILPLSMFLDEDSEYDDDEAPDHNKENCEVLCQ